MQGTRTRSRWRYRQSLLPTPNAQCPMPHAEKIAKINQEYFTNLQLGSHKSS
ncbi:MULTISPECIES: hypothetical protein [unclassified Nostoc]|uniref:hypothetical protein n=1 Tax=unclassified Nostoc TaxID=2593658 RepID=UPI002612041E|nr:hypothetical protein [Nostoc sp. S13]MDF5740206.1 hypothetical protein [Nostoc sp. S13]